MEKNKPKIQRVEYTAINNLKEKMMQLIPNIFKEDQIDINLLKSSLGMNETDEQNEKYGLTWPDKLKHYANAVRPSSLTLVPDRSKSMNFDESDNIIIEADNLQALKILQKSYQSQIDVIYIDPPYNTGKDFIYNDNFNDSLKDYKKNCGLVDEDGNKTTTDDSSARSGRKHTNWLNMMYSRLFLARNLLKDDGVIFISIDDNEQARLKMICDEIFGEENFVSNIIWEKSFAPKNNTKTFSIRHDYILVYSKSTLININRLKKDNEQLSRYKNQDNDYRGPWDSKDLSVINSKHCYEIKNPYTNTLIIPPSGRGWGIKYEKFLEYEKNNKIYWPKNGRGVPRLKKFLSEVESGKTPETIIFYKDVGHNQEGTQELKQIMNGSVFDFPKPKRLIKWLLDRISNKNGLILDFFAGSGTTGQAVMELNKEDGGNRKYIMVQLPEKINDSNEFDTICDITRERIKRSIEMFEYKEKGFKYFKLDTSNLKEWDIDQDSDFDNLGIFDNQINRIKENRSVENFMYEILLKMGLPLTMNFEKVEMNNTFYISKNKQLIFAFNNEEYKNIHKDLLIYIKDNNLENINWIVLSDSSFENDSTKMNCIENLKSFISEENKDISIEVF